jgi:hypothetical protein
VAFSFGKLIKGLGVSEIPNLGCRCRVGISIRWNKISTRQGLTQIGLIKKSMRLWSHGHKTRDKKHKETKVSKIYIAGSANHIKTMESENKSF